MVEKDRGLVDAVLALSSHGGGLCRNLEEWGDRDLPGNADNQQKEDVDREFDLVISAIGVLIFTALTAADTQKIQQWASDPSLASGGGDKLMRLSILGARTLYLDFLNLFIFLVRIFGRSR